MVVAVLICNNLMWSYNLGRHEKLIQEEKKMNRKDRLSKLAVSRCWLRLVAGSIALSLLLGVPGGLQAAPQGQTPGPFIVLLGAPAAGNKPFSNVTSNFPRSPRINSRIVAAFVSTIDSITSLPEEFITAIEVASL